MKDIRKRLNSEVDIIRIENGAYRPFKKILSAFLSHVVSSCTKLLVIVMLLCDFIIIICIPN